MPSRLGALLVVAAGLAYLVLANLIVLMLASILTPDPLDATAVVLAAGATTPIALSFVWLVRRWGRLSAEPPARPHGRALRTVALAIAVVFTGVVILSILHAAFGLEAREQAHLVAAVRNLPAWQVYLTLGLLAPLGEEIFFRRFVLTTLAQTFGRVVAHAGTVLLFATVHFNFGAIAIYAFIGLVLGIAYERTGRLYVPVAVHAINNLVVVAALLQG